MKKIDTDGLILCKIQGKIFEKSVNKVNSSSEIFIRRFMNSDIVTEMDSLAFLDGSLSDDGVIYEIEKEYGKTEYGKVKYNSEVMFWIGYLYRYFSYCYELSSKQVYKIVKPKELNQLYYVYHTFDCSQAIERILESKNISFDNPNEKILKLLRKREYVNNIVLEEITIDHSLFNDDKDKLKIEQNYREYVCKVSGIDKYAETEQKKDNILLAIIYKGNVTGEIRFKDIDNDCAKLEIIISVDRFKDKGFGSVSISKGLEYAKNVMKLKTISVEVLKSDHKSIHVFEKLGFKYKEETKKYIIFSKSL